MDLWSIIIPDLVEQVNLVKNPSVENPQVALNGYAAVGTGSPSRTTVFKKFGSYSIAVACSASGDGVYYGSGVGGQNLALVSGTAYTVQAWVRSGAGTPIRIQFRTTGGTPKGTAGDFTATGEWQLVYQTWTADATSDFRVYITRESSGSATFYADALCCVAVGYPIVHIDGDQDDCWWNGVPYASTSSRDKQSRLGGRERFFQADLGSYVISTQGIGIPPNKHHTTPQALLPGAAFDGRRILPRTIQLNVDLPGTSQSSMHALRRAILNAIKPDLTVKDQPFTLRYYGANSNDPVEINCVYDSGGEYVKLDGFTDQSPLRFIAYEDPFFHDIGSDGINIDVSDSLTTTNRILRRGPSAQGAEWQKLGTGMNGLVRVITRDRLSGRVYVGGDFTTGNGVTLNRIGYWDGATFVAMDSGVNGAVHAIIMEPNGDVWVAGAFTTVGAAAAACKGLARWNYASNTWTAFNPSTVTFTAVYALTRDTAGNIYVGGLFTDWSVAAGDYIAKWNGTSWSALGTGMNNQVFALGTDISNNVWAGGQFTTGNGVTLNGLGYWNGTTFVSVGGVSGSGAIVYALASGIDGSMFIGGDFTSAGGVSANFIARWNGASMEALGVGLGSLVSVLHVTDNGLLHIGGSFITAGGLDVVGYAMWNGSTWLHPDVILPSGSNLRGIATWMDNVYLGYDQAGTATASAQQNVVNNGTLSTYPVVRVWGWQISAGVAGAVVAFLRNETTGVEVRFDYELQSGEDLVIDFRPTKSSMRSTFYPNAWRGLSRGSDFASFNLLPGQNWISFLVKPPGSGSVSAQMEWRTMHWTGDGGE